MTLDELLERSGLPADTCRWLLHSRWRKELASEATWQERYELALVSWLHNACSWLSPLFYEPVLEFCGPFFRAIEGRNDHEESWTGIGIMDFRYLSAVGSAGFLDLQTTQVVSELQYPAVSYLWCDLLVMERRLRCHQPLSSASPSVSS